ncbi:hypothetical protein [Clostridium sp. LP20]|uniref:hypothetical protein n=1 Tax=Clostridium sp. LP20 TaxID=3418665 RepID=UPI003EE49A9E
MSWIDDIKDGAFKFLFKGKANEIEELNIKILEDSQRIRDLKEENLEYRYDIDTLERENEGYRVNENYIKKGAELEFNQLSDERKDEFIRELVDIENGDWKYIKTIENVSRISKTDLYDSIIAGDMNYSQRDNIYEMNTSETISAYRKESLISKEVWDEINTKFVGEMTYEYGKEVNRVGKKYSKKSNIDNSKKERVRDINYDFLSNEYDNLQKKFLDTYNELNEYKNINYALLDELNAYREKEVSIGNEEEIDIKKERIITENLNLEDGSFIGKGTSFFIEGFEDGKYNIHFANNSNNKYHNELGDNYLFNSKELSDFSKEVWNLSITENLTQYDLNNILDLELKEFNELVQALIPEDDIKFMEKRNLNISSYTQEYLNQAKEHDFEKEDFKSFHSYLDREIMGIMEDEYDRYNEKTYMERYEDMVLGKSNNIKSNDKDNSLSLDNISINTEITNNREKEQFLDLNKEELAKIYERQMTEEEKVFVEKQRLKLSDVVEDFKEVLEEFDIEKFSFKDYLVETIGTYNEMFRTRKEITIDNNIGIELDIFKSKNNELEME